MPLIDLRSDTVTRPTAAMRAAMLEAPVGDDVYGDDPTVNQLQERLAAELGFEAGLFAPSGTQSNLIGLMAHCGRGDEYLVGADAHTFKFEGGGAAVLGSIQPHAIPNQQDGTLDLAALEAAVKPIDPHFARTKLLALENTWHGRALPREYVVQAQAFARRRGLALHLDGARLFNAATAYGVAPRDVAAGFDSVSICFSKGLGAPIGSVLLGPRDFIDRARRWRKVAGGGWRQAGILAAGCVYALDHHVERLADDHARAERLAAGLRAIPGVVLEGQFTNMVFLALPADSLRELDAYLRAREIIVSIGYLPSVRLVTHLDIDDAAVDATLAAFSDFYAARV